jgi:4-amino-4-deoxy-L-arabinose transferase-like glycosyltransferase
MCSGPLSRVDAVGRWSPPIVSWSIDTHCRGHEALLLGPTQVFIASRMRISVLDAIGLAGDVYCVENECGGERGNRTLRSVPASVREPAPLGSDPELPVGATGAVVAVGAALAAVLVVAAGRYGYHRDELYFLAAGHHLAWGYPDQPPLVPFLARVLAPAHSVAVLRVPSALAAGAIVVLGGLSARELGAGRAAQILAATTLAVGAVLVGSGHLLSTATFDFLAWAVLVWLILRILRTGDDRLWLVVGAVTGVGLLDSDLVAFLMAAIVVGALVSGPRPIFRSPYLWAGGAIAAVIWSPYLVWQASHGWPQLAVSRSIAAGNSGSSTPRWLVVPEQLVLLSPWVAPIWVAGLLRLFRDRALRWARSIGVAYLVLAVVFTATGGKSYYLAGLFPVLVAAGAEPTIGWLQRGRSRARRALLVAGLALSAAGSVVLTLPVVPVGRLHTTTPQYDVGETVGWPTYVAEIAAAYRRVPVPTNGTVAILGSNYGESGAVDRYGAHYGLPPAYGVHMGYWYWGPPPPSATSVVAIGFDQDQLARFCTDPVLLTHLDNRLGVDNDEQGAPVWSCTALRAPWKTLWPHLRVIG